MKKVLQVLIVLMLSYSSVTAQWVTDSVSMGPGYGNNIFYAIGNGTQKTEAATNWHLAFSMNANDSAAIHANHNLGNEFVKVFNVHRPISDWANITLSDTATADLLYSGNKGWHQGAFNQIPHPSPFNFGWGTYNPIGNKLTGDSLFIVRAGAHYYNVSIDSLVNAEDWYFRTQRHDLIMVIEHHVVKKSSGYNNRLFAYFNLDSSMAYDREPAVSAWDMEFMTYPTFVQQGPTASWYGVTGALSNRGTAIAKAAMVDVDVAMAAYPTNTGGWENAPYTEIGYDWKLFNMGTNTYDIADSLSYFVSAKNDTVYQLQFLDFGGGANGNIKFRYRPMGSSPLAVNDFQTIGAIELFPNPAKNVANILFNATENTEARLTVTGLNGQVLVNQLHSINSGINAIQLNTANLAAGNYIISLQDKSNSVHKKMTVIR